MAEFNRKELRDIFSAAEIEVPKDVLTQLCELHAGSSEGMGESIRELKKQLATAEREKEEALKKVPADGEEMISKSVHDKLKQDFENYKKDVQAKETGRIKEAAVRELLRESGVSEKHLDSILRVYPLDDIEVDAEGKVKDAEKRVESIKADWADFIPTTQIKGMSPVNPPTNTPEPVSKEKFSRMSYHERVKIYEENPELYAKLNE